MSIEKGLSKEIYLLIALGLIAVGIANLPTILTQGYVYYQNINEPKMGEAFLSVQATSVSQLGQFGELLSRLPPEVSQRTVRIDWINKGRASNSCTGYINQIQPDGNNSYHAEFLTAGHCDPGLADGLHVYQPQQVGGCELVSGVSSVEFNPLDDYDIALLSTTALKISGDCPNLEPPYIVPETEIPDIANMSTLSFTSASVALRDVFISQITGPVLPDEEGYWCSHTPQYRGSSGGPVVDQKNGNLIGIMSYESEMGVCFAAADRLHTQK